MAAAPRKQIALDLVEWSDSQGGKVTRWLWGHDAVAIAILPAWGTGTWVGHLGSVTVTVYAVCALLDPNSRIQVRGQGQCNAAQRNAMRTGFRGEGGGVDPAAQAVAWETKSDFLGVATRTAQPVPVNFDSAIREFWVRVLGAILDRVRVRGLVRVVGAQAQCEYDCTSALSRFCSFPHFWLL